MEGPAGRVRSTMMTGHQGLRSVWVATGNEAVILRQENRRKARKSARQSQKKKEKEEKIRGFQKVAEDVRSGHLERQGEKLKGPTSKNGKKKGSDEQRKGLGPANPWSKDFLKREEAGGQRQGKSKKEKGIKVNRSKKGRLHSKIEKFQIGRSKEKGKWKGKSMPADPREAAKKEKQSCQKGDMDTKWQRGLKSSKGREGRDETVLILVGEKERGKRF